MLTRLLADLRRSPRWRRCSDVVARWPIVGRWWQRLRKHPRELERFAKFALVGMIGAAVDFTVLNVMQWLFESIGLGNDWSATIDPRQFQLAAANTISFSAAVLSNFTWNRLWTFPESRERPMGKQLVQFGVVNLIGWGINTVLLIGLDHYVFQNWVSGRASYNMAKAVAIAVVLFWNFGVNRVWTYGGIE